MITKSDCITLDKQDPLAELRDQFALPDNVIYFDGNSLGAQPKSAAARAQQIVEYEWGNNLIRSWNSAGWYELPVRLGNLLAPLIGANPGEVVIADSTSINLFKALAAALQIQEKNHPNKKIIVSERSNFPTDLYITQGLTTWLNRGYQLKMVDDVAELTEVINKDVAVVLLTHINYRSGAMHDMQSLTTYAHQHHALTIWDLCHSAGALPVDLNVCHADFAVGCTYKYLNGGPGSPAFIWIAERHLAEFNHPLSGWWGHAAPFAMQAEFVPVSTIRRALCGSPPIISLALIESGLDIFTNTNMHAIRKKSLALTDLFIELVEQECGKHDLQLITPRNHEQRGSQLNFTHPHAYSLIQALIDHEVIGDYREPSVMRFGFTPLYTRFVDVWNAVAELKDILDHEKFDIHLERNAVT